jgi:hypothetical protein
MYMCMYVCMYVRMYVCLFDFVLCCFLVGDSSGSRSLQRCVSAIAITTSLGLMLFLLDVFVMCLFTQMARL